MSKFVLSKCKDCKRWVDVHHDGDYPEICEECVRERKIEEARGYGISEEDLY